jgi:phage/plasmid-like protein (TIGR03299 family)
VVNAYLLLATACDGTLATTAQFTSIRVVCNNTLAIALTNGSGAVKVPHNTSFDPQAVKKQLGISVASWDAFMYRMKTLSERKVKSHEAMNYFLRVFTDASHTAGGLSNERAIKKVQALYDGQGKGAELASSKSTAFGLLNSVTEYAIMNDVPAVPITVWNPPGSVRRGLETEALDQALLMIA